MATIGSGDSTLYYEDHGSGFPVFLVPGLGGVCTCWAAQVSVFAREFRVIVHDHRGTGRGARPVMDYSVEQMTADLLRIMDACGIARAHLVGHSTGGAIGQTLAIDHPDRIAGFVGANTWTHCDPFFEYIFRVRRGLLERGDIAAYASAGSLLLWAPQWIAANMERVAREEQIMRDNFPDPRVVMGRIDAICRFDRRAGLGKIKAPTLIFGSEDDMITPAYFSRDLAKRIPGAKLAMLPYGGHSSYQTMVESWNDVVLNFLRSLPQIMKLPRERVPYSAIVDRPKLKLPDGGRMIVWTMVNVEEWGIERPMPRTVLSPPMGQPLLPDLPNWAWHEYGMRVGFWRFYDCLRSRGIVPTLAINGSVCTSYPRVARAALDAGWEFLGHGFLQGPMHKVEDQRQAIRQTIEAIRAFTGRKPRGWESPGLTETYETIDILAEEGIEYVADWVLDDQPCEIATSAGPVVSVPYTVETNDITMMALQHHASEEMLTRSVDQFDRLYQESTDITRVMCVSLHPYISGVPHRIKYVEQLFDYMQRRPGVLFWTGEQVLDWYKTVKS